MKAKSLRFESLIEPCGTWMVLDRTICAPAWLGGLILRGQTGDRSRVARNVLNRIYSSQLDARSVARCRGATMMTLQPV